MFVTGTGRWIESGANLILMAFDVVATSGRIAEMVERDYLVPALGQQAAAQLNQFAATGNLDDVDPAEFAARVTKLLQSVTDDLHLRVIHHPDGAPDLEDDDVYEARWRDQAAVTAGGVRRVERVPGNIAVVEFGPIIGLPAHAGNWLTAAMSLCRGADAVVLDLRECVGGTPDGVALICSYLLGPEPVHITDILDRHGRRQFWTAALVPGDRLPATCPVAVLVSQRTFSGGEDLAFNLQELGRATVIGATTRGGAHPRIGVRVHDQLELALPIARPVSPRSGGNWEGIGVQPDIPCDPEGAFARAVELLGNEAPPPAAPTG